MDTGIYFAGFLVSAAAAVLVIFWLNPRLTVWRVCGASWDRISCFCLCWEYGCRFVSRLLSWPSCGALVCRLAKPSCKKGDPFIGPELAINTAAVTPAQFCYVRQWFSGEQCFQLDLDHQARHQLSAKSPNLATRAPQFFGGGETKIEGNG